MIKIFKTSSTISIHLLKLHKLLFLIRPYVQLQNESLTTTKRESRRFYKRVRVRFIFSTTAGNLVIVMSYMTSHVYFEISIIGYKSVFLICLSLQNDIRVTISLNKLLRLFKSLKLMISLVISH